MLPYSVVSFDGCLPRDGKMSSDDVMLCMQIMPSDGDLVSIGRPPSDAVVPSVGGLPSVGARVASSIPISPSSSCSYSIPRAGVDLGATLALSSSCTGETTALPLITR